MRAFPDARRFAVVCGGGSNGGDGRVAAACCASAGVDAVETDDPVGAATSSSTRSSARGSAELRERPRPGAHRADQRVPGARRRGRPPVGRRCLDGRGRRRRRARRSDRHVPRAQGRARRRHRAASTPARSWSPTSGSSRPPHGRGGWADGDPAPPCRGVVHATRSSPRRSCSSSAVRPGRPGPPSSQRLAALRADAGYVTLCVPEACLPVVEMLALEPVKRGSAAERCARDDPAEALGVPEPSRSGRGWDAPPARTRSSRGLLERLEVPVVVDADALFGLLPVATVAPDGADAARGRARATPRPRAPPGSTRTGSRRRPTAPSGSTPSSC